MNIIGSHEPYAQASNSIIDWYKKLIYLRKEYKILIEKIASTFSERSSGILLNITSLPSYWGIGDMGKEAVKFIDFLHNSGQSYWQILPLNPLGLGNSPYQSPSLMAGNILLISPECLHEVGLLSAKEMKEGLTYLKKEYINEDKVNYSLVEKCKEWLFHQAWSNYKNMKGKVELENNYTKFVEQNSIWLDDYCLYMALKKKNNHQPWVDWEKDIALRERNTLVLLKQELVEDIEYQSFMQFIFYHQWKKIKSYANQKGIKIIGDLPIYAAADSCDTWVYKNLFKLDSEGKPLVVAGVPPDYFSKTGQNWGNPIYEWLEMKKDGYTWWKSRLRQALSNYDYIRLDHFRGFVSYWEIPACENTAINGRWLQGPGKCFFDALKEEFGELPFIIEDLGILTAEVYNLKNILGFPGMRIFQFDPSFNFEESNIVFYSGTHDNDTLIGWYNKDKLSDDFSDEQKIIFVENILSSIYKSKADLVIIPMQDILKLDSNSRMNTPGTIGGNWVWRMKDSDLTLDTIKWLKSLSSQSDRMVKKII